MRARYLGYLGEGLYRKASAGKIPEVEDEAPIPGPGAAERCLILAVIERAALDYIGCGRSILEGNNASPNVRSMLKREVYRWLFDKLDDGTVEFTFVWCCDQLSIDPTRVRKAILAEVAAGKGAKKTCAGRCKKSAAHYWRLVEHLQD